MKYFSRLNMWKNYKASCTFNPETMLGHSYSWYELSKKVKGVMILNTYLYSNQTAKHVGKMRDLFANLKIKYVSLEAPRGLQSLDLSLVHHVEQLAHTKLKNSFARIKDKNEVKRHENALKLLEKLGFKATKKMHAEAEKNAIQCRTDRLARDKMKRERNKARAIKVETVAGMPVESSPVGRSLALVVGGAA